MMCGFGFCQLKHKAFRESFIITLNGLVQDSCFDRIKYSQVRIQYDFLPTYLINDRFNGRCFKWGIVVVHNLNPRGSSLMFNISPEYKHAR